MYDVVKVGGIVMVDGNDEWLSGTYGTDGADTCTHDDVACDDCVGSDLIAISICGGCDIWCSGQRDADPGLSHRG